MRGNTWIGSITPILIIMFITAELLVKQTDENLKVGKFVGDLLNGHTKFINKKYQRTGVVFEGPAKAKYVMRMLSR